MSKWWLLLLLCAIPTLLFWEKEDLQSVSYLVYFQKKEGRLYRSFREKIKTGPSSWMQKQIEGDLKEGNFSLQAIGETQGAICEKGITYTNRYRIANQKLYRYFDANSAREQALWPEPRKETISLFEKALQTLLALTALPDVDFIVTHEDGMRDPFHLVKDPTLQAPIFGWAKLKTTPFLVLIPDWRSLSSWWHDDIRKLKEGKNFQGEPVPWSEKQPLAFWRGGLTEPVHRLKIASLSQEFPLLVDAGIHTDPSNSLYKPPANYEKHLGYKYLPVLDGIMCTYPGYQWRLLSDSVAFKQESDQIQWFYEGLSPYVHYVPIKEDLSDLLDQIQWAQDHDEICEQISQEATKFALENLMFDDVYVYLYHVLAAYSKKQNLKVGISLEHFECLSENR